MTRPTLEVHATSVAGYAVFTCRECGRSGRGEWFKMDIGGVIPTTDEVNATISPGHMPVGWASYGRSEYACPEHAK